MASVDDIDELIATRKLNGLNDNLYKNETMSEEAFNEIIDNFEVVTYLTEYGRRGIKENVKKLQARIKELEEDLYIANYTVENSISIQKINDQIEKYEHMLALTALGEIQKYTPGEVLLKIDTLKELLEENNK